MASMLLPNHLVVEHAVEVRQRSRSPSRPYRHRRNAQNKERTLLKIDESRQDGWLDRARQNLHCSLICGGSACKHESWDAMRPDERRRAAIEGLNSNWVGKNVIASQRLSTSLFVKHPLIQQFRAKNVTGVLNLQEKGEHSLCGPDGVYGSSGYSYNGAEDLMPHGICYYEFPWPDMTAPQQDIVLRSVQVMDYHVKNKGKVLVHCHAGLGRTGLLIACYYVYSQHLSSAVAIALVREARPGAIQTVRQGQFVKDFEAHLWRLARAFRVELSDTLISLDLFIQRQHRVLHGEKADLYRWVPMFLHVILCRLLSLTRDDAGAAVRALESLGQSCAPDPDTLAACKAAINRRHFRVQQVTDVTLLSFLVGDWFRATSMPVLSIEDCDAIVELQRTDFTSRESVPLTIRRTLSRATRHTLGMVISAFTTIARTGGVVSVTRYAFRCLADAFNHAFNPVKLRHSPIERELMLDFFLAWGQSIGDMYFNLDSVTPAHRTIKRIAIASTVVLQSMFTARSANATSTSGRGGTAGLDVTALSMTLNIPPYSVLALQSSSSSSSSSGASVADTLNLSSAVSTTSTPRAETVRPLHAAMWGPRHLRAAQLQAVASPDMSSYTNPLTPGE